MRSIWETSGKRTRKVAQMLGVVRHVRLHEGTQREGGPAGNRRHSGAKTPPATDGIRREIRCVPISVWEISGKRDLPAQIVEGTATYDYRFGHNSELSSGTPSGAAPSRPSLALSGPGSV